MAARAEKSGAEASSIAEQLDAFIDAQVQVAVKPYLGKLSERDLAWMRERLAASIRENPAMLALARAGVPLDVDESAEIARPSAKRDDER
ncbi:MAG: hypothetical protein HOW73_41415 [Polyangiaceae bacterium]|nr:hypothetical protein [Polyangiaceae bacterium]